MYFEYVSFELVKLNVVCAQFNTGHHEVMSMRLITQQTIKLYAGIQYDSTHTMELVTFTTRSFYPEAKDNVTRRTGSRLSPIASPEVVAKSETLVPVANRTHNVHPITQSQQ